MLQYPVFYNHAGIRKVNEFLVPRLFDTRELLLPRHAIYHFVPVDPLTHFPDHSDPMINGITKIIPVLHILNNTELKGAPRPISHNFNDDIRKFHSKHRQFRLVKELEQGLRDEQAPVLINYGILGGKYKYLRSMFTEYNRLSNIQTTVWDTLNDLLGRTDRHHFLVVRTPDHLPNIGELKAAVESMAPEVDLLSPEIDRVFNAISNEKYFNEELNVALESETASIALEAMSARLIKIFGHPETMMLLDLWRWSGEDRKKSRINRIKRDALHRVNLVFMESGKWCVMNLGVIDSWRVPTKQELEENPDLPTKGLNAKQIQIRMLHFFNTLFKMKLMANQQSVEEKEAAKNEDVDVDVNEVADIRNEIGSKDTVITPDMVTQTVLTSTDTTGGMDSLGGKVITQTTVKKPVIGMAGSNDKHVSIELPDDIKIDEHFEAELERELLEQEHLMASLQEQRDQLAKKKVVLIQPHVELPLDHGVVKRCNELADMGAISAAEYKRFLRLANSHNEITAPDGKTKLTEFVKVTPEHVKIATVPAIEDIKTVTDKTMLKSTLMEFDKRYIKEIMHRDIASMVMHLQNAAICVTDYKVETRPAITGDTDAIHVRLAPVEGSSSTFRMTIPHIEEDGTFTANGTKYRFLKQRSDLPLRKLSPTLIGLTSYYGKTFVTRSEKRVNDYGNWLRSQVSLISRDGSGLISNLNAANVFQNNAPVPRTYSMLATEFTSFTLHLPQYPRSVGGEIYLSFDYKNRFKLGDEATILALEKEHHAVVVGKGRAYDDYILMNKDGKLAAIGGKYTTGNLTALGDLVSALDLPIEKAPVDFALLKVHGEWMPVAFVLAYELGLTTLMSSLNVEPRRVMAGQRVNLAKDEFSVVFSDETLVFKRDGSLANLILASFNEYHSAIRDFSVYDFDNQSVYVAILEDMQISVRYLRELNLMYQLFIDPITRELLVERKLPTDMRGLIVKACELLLIDYHPNEMSGREMRTKGYERVAGMIYNQMVQSIRAHNGSAGKQRRPLEMNPKAVWHVITSDASVALVQDINPMENLKEQEAVTYNGEGGRSKRSMTAKTRVFEQDEVGIRSEATKDSSDVAYNTYTPANPLFNSLRGTADPMDMDNVDPTSLISSSALNAVGGDRDD